MFMPDHKSMVLKALKKRNFLQSVKFHLQVRDITHIIRFYKFTVVYFLDIKRRK